MPKYDMKHFEAISNNLDTLLQAPADSGPLIADEATEGSREEPIPAEDERLLFKDALEQLEGLPKFTRQRRSKRQWVADEYDQILVLRQKGYPFAVIAQKISELMPAGSGIATTTLAKHFRDITKEKRRLKRSANRNNKLKTSARGTGKK